MGLPTGAGRAGFVGPGRHRGLPTGCRCASMGLPTGAGREAEGARLGFFADAASMGLPTGAGRLGRRRATCFNGAADRGRQRGSSVPTAKACVVTRSFNGAADRGRQEGAPCGADEPRAADLALQWARPGPAGSGPGAGRGGAGNPHQGFNGAADRGRQRGILPPRFVLGPASWGSVPALQWGCRPGPAEGGLRRGGTSPRASMGLPTGAGRGVEGVRTSRCPMLQWGCRPGPAERGSWRARPCRHPRFNGAADRGRQRGLHSGDAAAAPSSGDASMGLPTGAGREASITMKGQLAVWASMGLPTGAGRERSGLVRARLAHGRRGSPGGLQWGCRPGPAERRCAKGRPTSQIRHADRFNGAADRGRQRAAGPAQRPRPLQWGCRPGPAERGRAWRPSDAVYQAEQLQWGCRPGPAGEVARPGRRATRCALQWGCRPGPAEGARPPPPAGAASPSPGGASMGLPTGAGREAQTGREAIVSGIVPTTASMGLPTGAGRGGRYARDVHGVALQWGCRPGPAGERGRAPAVRTQLLQWGCRPGPAEG